MAIGSIGKKVVFETSSRKVLTFMELTKTVKGRWGRHERIGKKPKKQFLGPEDDVLTLTIILSAQHGVKPRKTAEIIENMISKGTVERVVIGNKAISPNKFAITEMSEAWNIILNRGEVAQMTLELTLEEYL